MGMRRLIVWFPVLWTLTMGVWLALYQQTQATCGPEIERDCSIGLSVTSGLGRPGIILLWSLGIAAYAVALLTDRRRRSRGSERPPRDRRRRSRGSERPPRSRSHTRPAVGVLAVVLAATIGLALPASPSPRRALPPVPAAGVDVHVISAILHPSASSAGRNRHAARVSVHVRLVNRGSRPVSTTPALISGGAMLPYDRRQFALGPLRPGVAVDATLRFEPRSTFTQGLLTERDARLQIAGRTIPLTLKIGSPVRKSRLRGVPIPRRTRPATTRRRPAPVRTRATPRPATRRPPAPPAPPRAQPPPPPPPPPQPPAPRRQPAPDEQTGKPFDDSG